MNYIKDYFFKDNKPNTSYKKKKTLIIGSGPAGILSAYFSKKNNFDLDQITICGKFDDAQLRTISYNDVSFDVNACYMSNEYNNTIIELMKEYNYSIGYYKMSQYRNNDLDISIYDLPNIIRIFILSLHKQVYNILSETSISKYIYSVSFEDYLNNSWLGELNNYPLFRYAIYNQGYGGSKPISSYHTFKWITFNLFSTTIYKYLTHTNGSLPYIPNGYQNLFREIYDDIKITKKDNFVRKVMKQNGLYKYKVFFDNGSIDEYDRIIMTCDPRNIILPRELNILSGIVEDTKFFSYAFVSDKKLTNQIIDKGPNIPLTYVNRGYSNGVYVYWTLGYVDDMNLLNDNNLEEHIKKYFKDNHDMEIHEKLYMRILNYNLRLNIQAIKDGVHLELNELNGIDDFYLSGGLFSHWNIDSIYEKTEELFKKMKQSK